MTRAKSSHPNKTRWHFDAHHRFVIAMALAAATVMALHHRVSVPTQIVAGWDVFALVDIALALYVLTTRDPYETRRAAQLQDSNQSFLFVLVISATVASLFAVLFLLGSSGNHSGSAFALDVALSIGAIILSWILVHLLFSLHYAHLYYIDARKLTRDRIKGGLQFPGDTTPDFLDFVYFSLVIGMTCQVSDVQVTSQKLRRLVSCHGLISFIFNTAILAVFVNIIAGLFK